MVSGNQEWLLPVEVHIWFHTTAQWSLCPLLAGENYFPVLPCLLVLVASPRLNSHHCHAPWSLTSSSCWISPWIRVEVCYTTLRSREENPNATNRVDGHRWTKPHSAPNVSSCSHVTCGNAIDRDHDRTSVFFPMWIRLWKIAEIIAQLATSLLTDDLRKAHQPTKMVMQFSLWKTVYAYLYWNSSFSGIFQEEIIYFSISLIVYLAKNL